MSWGVGQGAKRNIEQQANGRGGRVDDLVGATALLDDAAELLELALRAEERAEALLRQLARLLVL